jgi:hypothetical protein
MLAPTRHDCTATTMSTGHSADIELTEPTASDLEAHRGHLAAKVIDVDPHLAHNGTFGDKVGRVAVTLTTRLPRRGVKGRP